jgi:hypothetical protein
MTMRKFISRAIGALAALSMSLFAAQAVAASICGMTGSNGNISLGTYDAFSPTGITNPTVSITFTRFSGTGGKKTQEVNFYFIAPVGSPAYQLKDVTAGTGNLLYIQGQSHPTLTVNGGDAGADNLPFGGADDGSETITRTFSVTIPPGTDLTAGLDVNFDIVYQCKGTGGFADQNHDVTLANAVTLHLRVLSALQASYVGSALDFGELGTTTTSQVTAAPATYTKSGNIRVASTGPYTVSMSSGNSNRYRMTYSGGSASPSGAGNIGYSVKFLGQTKSPASTTFSTVTCSRAGVSGQNLPISATLLEGGAAKTAASDYQDILSITVTPLATATTPKDCPTL